MPVQVKDLLKWPLHTVKAEGELNCLHSPGFHMLLNKITCPAAGITYHIFIIYSQAVLEFEAECKDVKVFSSW